MKKWAISVSIVTLAAILCAPLGYAQEIEVTIQVSPSTLVLDGPGKYVTVHADISLSAVDTAKPVTLNGVDASSVFADDCGDLVAKFEQAAIENTVDKPSDTLTLVGTTVDGVTFSGSDTVMVKDSNSKKK